MRVNGARLLATLAGPRAHLARSGAGRQGRTFGRIEHRGLEVRRLVRRIGAVEIGDAGRRKGRDQHGGPMMRTIQVWLGERIRCFFRGFLMFVLMMPRMRGLSLGGFVTAILRHRCERDLQRKKAKKENEKQTLHLATESSINAVYGKVAGCTRATSNFQEYYPRFALASGVASPVSTRFRNSEIALRKTRSAEARNKQASASPTRRSGHCACVNHTPAAAINTAMFDAMSLREHSHTEFMLISSCRCFQRSARQVPFAASARMLIAPMTSNIGTPGTATL